MALSFQDKVRPVASTTKGVSFSDKVRTKAQAPVAPPEKDFLQKAEGVISSIFPGQKVGQAIGTLAGLGISKLQGTSKYYDTSAPSPLQVVADVAQGALMVAGGGAAKGATTIPKLIEGGALLGAGFGGTGAIAEGKGAEDVTKQTLLGGILGGATGGLFGLGGKAFSFLKGNLSKKTVQQVINTAEENVGKLNEAERAVYYAAKSRGITAQTTIEKQALAQTTQKQITTLQNETKAISEELAKASRDEVLRLRPKIINAMGNQSQQYRTLVEKELNNFKNVQVSPAELEKFVMQRYGNDPQMATEVLSRLGSNKATVSVLELYKQSVSLGQEIGTAARKGTRTFTPEEKITDDTISTLVDFLKTKGVDLTNARQFWAKWAPVRNQLVSEAKPFVQSETLTGTFANRLSKIAQGKDVNNTTYINEVEKLVGPIGQDLKAIVQKLNATQKQIVAVKLEAEAKRAGIQLSTQEARAALGEVKAKAELTAEHRARILGLLKGILLTLGVGYGAVRGGEYISGL